MQILQARRKHTFSNPVLIKNKFLASGIKNYSDAESQHVLNCNWKINVIFKLLF